MGEIEHAGTSKTMPRIKTSDGTAGEVAGEIHGEPTIKTEAVPGGAAEEQSGRAGEAQSGQADKVANQRGMPPISRP